MLSFIKCKRNTETIKTNPKVSKTRNERTTLLSKYAVSYSKESKFMKK